MLWGNADTRGDKTARGSQLELEAFVLRYCRCGPDADVDNIGSNNGAERRWNESEPGESCQSATRCRSGGFPCLFLVKIHMSGNDTPVELWIGHYWEGCVGVEVNYLNESAALNLKMGWNISAVGIFSPWFLECSLKGTCQS